VAWFELLSADNLQNMTNQMWYMYFIWLVNLQNMTNQMWYMYFIWLVSQSQIKCPMVGDWYLLSAGGRQKHSV